MFSLLALLQRNLTFILFIFFELISFYLIINYNQKQREIFLHSSSLFSSTALEQSSKISDYFSLRDLTIRLQEENAELLMMAINNERTTPQASPGDSILNEYELISARIISQSIHSQRNYITIDKGASDGVENSMGLINQKGVLGITKKVTDHYSTALSLLHSDIRISASIEDKNYFGTISWNGREFSKVKLEGIPIHANVSVGEKVVTNGYSTIFPKGVLIGEITKVSQNRKGVFYDIEVEIKNDFSSVSHVYVVKNNFSPERLQLDLE